MCGVTICDVYNIWESSCSVIVTDMYYLNVWGVNVYGLNVYVLNVYGLNVYGVNVCDVFDVWKYLRGVNIMHVMFCVYDVYGA